MLRGLRTRLAGEGEQLVEPCPSESWRVRAIAFEVSLNPGEETDLRVSYRQPAAGSRHDSYSFDLVQIDYILETARSWKSFSNLEIEVLAPPSARVEASLPLVKELGDGVDRYRFRSTSLPEDNLRVGAAIPLPLAEVFWRILGRGDAGSARRGVEAMAPFLVVTALAVAVGFRKHLSRKRPPQSE